MDSLKKFIKEHTLGFIFIVFCIIMLVVGIKIAFMFLSGKGGNKYGDRSKVLSYFDIDELGYYDVQVYVKCDKCTPGEDGTSIYPIIGYKKNTSESLVWSNN